MKRTILVRDAAGERCYPPDAYPLALGGDGADVALGGGERVLAYIGSERDHPFVQPADEQSLVWHNHQQLQGSAWLKSGDQLQIDRYHLSWQVQGDQIILSVSSTDVAATPRLTPPPSPPPQQDGTGVLAENPSAGRPPRHGLRWFLLGMFGLLLGAAAFVMLATPVNLEIKPKPDSLALRGLLPGVLVGDAFLALPGSYTLSAGRAGYRELRRPLEVRHGEPVLVRETLRKQPGLVSVESSPQGARLSIDGKVAGQTPLLDLEVEPGRHLLRLEAARHLAREFELEVIGMQQRQQLNLTLQPDWARVSVKSEPSGAEVSEEGRPLGRTPVDLELKQGTHELALSAPGYKPVQVRLQVRAGEPRELPLVRLDPADGVLKLQSEPEGSSVSVDGRFQGRTPLELELSPNTSHSIRLTRAGYRAASIQLQLAPEERREQTVRLQPDYGIVFISSQPADAELLVDGKPRGSATGRLKLSTRVHSIEVRKPGYQSYRTTVLPSAGFSRNLQVVLQPLGGDRTKASGDGANSQLKLVQASAPFDLGASRREPGRRANENLRRVELTRPYYLGVREVSNGEFRRFRARHDSGAVNGVSLNGDRQPVVNVSWDDAARYLNWLSRQEGLPEAYVEENGRMRLKRPLNLGYRLPSEAEWAYAARFAGREQAARYPWPGNVFPPREVQGNYADTSARGLLPVVLEDYRDGHAVSAPVGSFEANPAGLYDMDGNVAEWVHDYYAVYPGVVGKTTRDPLGPAQGRHHVVRGSGWRDAGRSELRLSYRDYSEKARNDLGFRVARYAR